MADVTATLWKCMRTVRSYFLLLLAGVLLGADTRPCPSKEVKMMIKQCYPHLAAIQTAILFTTADDFTSTCNAYLDYITCMETRRRGCESKFFDDYYDRRRIYSNVPYNCSNPSVVTISYDYSDEQMEGKRDKSHGSESQHFTLSSSPPSVSCSHRLLSVVMSSCLYLGQLRWWVQGLH